MAFYLLRITCDQCSVQGVAREGPSGSHYELPDGSLAQLRSTPAWCLDCATAVEAERFSTVGQLERELEDFRNGGPIYQQYVRDMVGFPAELHAALVESHLNDLRATASWRALRASPPRCLACGSAKVTPFEYAADGTFRPVPHAHCGGLLRVAVYAHAAGVPRGHRYSVEGERLLPGGPER
jgi:phytoene dehydrogenase-like protein